jgi:hypothetical protein
MSERYWITGVQLGLLHIGSEATRKSIKQNIMANQFIGNYITPKDQKTFLRVIGKILTLCEKEAKK